MKNLIKKSFIVVLLFTTIITSAKNSNPGINARLSTAKSINLTLKNFDGDLAIYVKDSEGIILYKENFKKSTISKKYDFTSLPNGNYFFEINGQTKVNIVPFTVASTAIKLLKKNEAIYFKPIVRLKDDAVYITKLALHSEAMEITMYDNQSNLIYTEEVSGSLNLDRKLNLSKLESGVYKLVLKSEGRTYTKNINKL